MRLSKRQGAALEADPPKASWVLHLLGTHWCQPVADLARSDSKKSGSAQCDTHALQGLLGFCWRNRIAVWTDMVAWAGNLRMRIEG